MCLFGVAAAAKKQTLCVEKTNKSELLNRLTYRVLIYIFEVRMNFFFSNEKYRGQNPNLEKFKNKKRPHFIFLRLEAEFFFFGFKTYPPMSLNFCKSSIS